MEPSYSRLRSCHSSNSRWSDAAPEPNKVREFGSSRLGGSRLRRMDQTSTVLGWNEEGSVAAGADGGSSSSLGCGVYDAAHVVRQGSKIQKLAVFGSLVASRWD